MVILRGWVFLMSEGPLHLLLALLPPPRRIPLPRPPAPPCLLAALGLFAGTPQGFAGLTQRRVQRHGFPFLANRRGPVVWVYGLGCSVFRVQG